MNDNAENFLIHAEIQQEAQEATLCLLLAKIKQEVLLSYFLNVEKSFAASPMWTKYSILKSMLKLDQEIIKQRRQKYWRETKSKNFSKKASDGEYLQVKVAVILGVAGACRCNELTFLDISHVQDKGLYVLIPVRKQNISRSFTIMEEALSVNAVEMCRKYINLRPKAADRKCTTQHVGINTISKTFSKVVSFLGLPDRESFTGHGVRRSSAILLANAGGDITTVKHHTVVGSRLRLRKIVLKNHCPARWQFLKNSRCSLMSARLWALPVIQKLRPSVFRLMSVSTKFAISTLQQPW
ncbi:hypothetical protein NQ315_002843 [Exocentrus adspersus]|uniref:Tyr recombinase domain-containing protein n=1 Tax=Exocentrus adspersus TaxID=1586481 RepID=A0AAV8VK92_9CUCU|nr:hypothetical protein NQ315_002843 [Exocentrus adspersus]